MRISASSGRIQNNAVSESGEHGMVLGPASANFIQGNVLSSNAGFGLRIEANSDANDYSGNTANGNAGTDCTGTASGGDFCDEGTSNTSHGDNYMPGKM